MNRGELIATVAQETGYTQKQVGEVLNSTLGTIVNAVAGGQKVLLVGFGSFEPRDRQAKNGRNPKTGESIKIAATRVPGFSAGSEFKKKVKNG